MMQTIKLRKMIMVEENPLQKYYKQYLNSVSNLSRASVKHYIDAINNISRNLCTKGLLKRDLYEVETVTRLNELWEILQQDKDFLALNSRGHGMYSAGFNHYRKFVSGALFAKMQSGDIEPLDIPADPPARIIADNVETWQRSDIIRRQVIEYAKYTCELGGTAHKTFIAASTNHQYMEAHHAIPLHLQNNFANSLDVYANVICLCPVCHRKLHYGLNEDKRLMMDEIYEKRATRLEHSGLLISKENFENTILERDESKYITRY